VNGELRKKIEGSKKKGRNRTRIIWLDRWRKGERDIE